LREVNLKIGILSGTGRVKL